MATTQIKDGYQGGSDNQWKIGATGAGLVEVTNPSGSAGWSNFGQSTPKQVMVSDTSTQLLAANPSRAYASISNNSSQTIYIQYGIDAVWQTGFRISPGAVWIVNSMELFTGEINAITSTGSINIDVIEGVT